jgi:hypothetical protein
MIKGIILILISLTILEIYRTSFNIIWGIYSYRYHKLRKYFTKFYHGNSSLNCDLKTRLQLDIGKPDFYEDVVYKRRRIMGHKQCSAVITKIIKRFIKRGYDPIIL